MVDVTFIDVGFEGGVRSRDEIGIACRVDHHFGQDGVTAFLALEDGAFDDVAFKDRCGGPGVQQQPHFGLAHHLHGYRFQRFRVHRW